MISHNYTLLCEHARMEANGKWIIIGLLPNGIATPQIPFPLPSFTFFQALAADSPGQYKFTAKLSVLDTGQVLAQAQGHIMAAGAGPVILPVALPNLQFKAFGMYSWSLEIEGQTEPFLTQFEIRHVPFQQVTMMPPKL